MTPASADGTFVVPFSPGGERTSGPTDPGAAVAGATTAVASGSGPGLACGKPALPSLFELVGGLFWGASLDSTAGASVSLELAQAQGSVRISGNMPRSRRLTQGLSLGRSRYGNVYIRSYDLACLMGATFATAGNFSGEPRSRRAERRLFRLERSQLTRLLTDRLDGAHQAKRNTLASSVQSLRRALGKRDSVQLRPRPLGLAKAAKIWARPVARGRFSEFSTRGLERLATSARCSLFFECLG